MGRDSFVFILFLILDEFRKLVLGYRCPGLGGTKRASYDEVTGPLGRLYDRMSNGELEAGVGRRFARGARAWKARQFDLDIGSAMVLDTPGTHETRRAMRRAVQMSTAAVSMAPVRGEDEWWRWNTATAPELSQ